MKEESKINSKLKKNTNMKVKINFFIYFLGVQWSGGGGGVGKDGGGDQEEEEDEDKYCWFIFMKKNTAQKYDTTEHISCTFV